MRFSARLPNDTATLLLIASFIIVLIGLTNASHDPASHHNKTISIVGSTSSPMRERCAAACTAGVVVISGPGGVTAAEEVAVTNSRGSTSDHS